MNTKATSLITALLTACALTCFTQSLRAACGDVTLNSQTDVNDFATLGCDGVVSGNLIIQDTSAGIDPIINLDGLSSLTSVGGFLLIRPSPGLTNLDGLSSLTSIGGNLDITDNAALANLDGLSSLTSVGRLLILNNDALTDLDGLSSLTSVGFDLRINNNEALTDLDGLSSLTSVGDVLDIENNAKLDRFCGLFPLLSGGGLSGAYSVGDNAVDPSQQDILDHGSCNDNDGDGVADDVDLCPGTPAGEAVDANGCAASQLDTDGDALTDDVDQCPNSDLREIVWIGGCDSGVSNDIGGALVDETGCSLADYLAIQLSAAATDARNHGQFVRTMVAYLNVLVAMDVLTDDEQEALMSCVGAADESQFLAP